MLHFAAQLSTYVNLTSYSKSLLPPNMKRAALVAVTEDYLPYLHLISSPHFMSDRRMYS
jgi:hypothetical protein